MLMDTTLRDGEHLVRLKTQVTTRGVNAIRYWRNDLDD
jgi:hypothetical protein